MSLGTLGVTFGRGTRKDTWDHPGSPSNPPKNLFWDLFWDPKLMTFLLLFAFVFTCVTSEENHVQMSKNVQA